MDDFDLFLKLAKPLLLNLPNARDRTMAALWLKKLCDVSSRESEPESENIHVEFLKLLLFVMQGDQLTGIFEKPPPQGSLHDILQSGQRKAADMIHLVKRRRRSSSRSRSISSAHPRVATSIGGDMCEYVAVQEIPNFGIHGYYALSTEPVTKWWNPRSSMTSEVQSSSLPILKTAYDSARTKERDSAKDSETENFETARNETGNSGAIIAERTEAGPSKGFSKGTHEKPRHSEKSLRNIFQAQRSEIAGVETRPSWGRSRYIDRLIDESPHLVGDLDLSEADALLHLYRDKKLMKVTKGGRSGAKDSACAVSSRRRQVEARLDMPPCASVPVEEAAIQEAAERESRTCLPRRIDSDCMDQVRRGNYDRCCLSENEEYYPTDPIESVGSVSLRGGSDDAGLASSSGCCQGRRDERRVASQKSQPTRNTPRNGNINNAKSCSGAHEGMDLDREIAEATALTCGKVPIDVDKAGNFAWVKKERCRFIKDHRKMTSRDFGANADQRDRSERYDIPDSRRGEGCRWRTQRDYGRRADRNASGSGTQPSQAMSQKTILRSKAATPEGPGVDEKTRYWNEILDLEDTMDDPSMPESYDASCCGCRDRQYGSEISMETPAHNWRDFAYASEDEETGEDRTTVEEPQSRSPRTMLSSNDSNALREEVRRLVTDPVRRAPPSTGRIKTPRKKAPRAVGQTTVEEETWDPPGHSTTVGH